MGLGSIIKFKILFLKVLNIIENNVFFQHEKSVSDFHEFVLKLLISFCTILFLSIYLIYII